MASTRDRRISIRGQSVAEKFTDEENRTANARIAAERRQRRSVATMIKEAVVGQQFIARLGATRLGDFISVMNLFGRDDLA